MALKQYKPATPGQRQLVLVDRAGLHKGGPVKALTEGKTSKGPRNNTVRGLVRWQGRAYALSAQCTHRGAALVWRADEGRVFCPKHEARFRPDGVHASGRRARDLDRFDIRQRGNTLVVDLTALRRADADVDAWQAAVVRLA